MAIVPNGAAPYPPAGKVIDLVERHRAQGLPTPLNADKIERLTGTPGLAQRLMKTLTLLDLIDGEGAPTAQFENLAKVPTDAEFKDRFADMIRSAYADVFQYIDPANATYEQIEGQFRNYTPRGQLARMVALFRGLCEYAGLMQPGSVVVPTKTPGAASRAGTAVKQKSHGPRVANSQGPVDKPGSNRLEPRKEPPPDEESGVSAKERYVNLLLAQAEQQPDPELLDRIERVLGVPPAATSSPPASEGGEDP